MIVAPGATQVSVDVFFADDTGAALTGKVAADFPACKWSGGSNTADTTITLSDLAAITTAHPNDNTAGGVKEREGGWYRLDLPNNMVSAAGRKTLTFAETTNKRIIAPFVDCQYTQINAIQLAGQTITAAAGVTFPSSIASPTNITAATGITVATNSDKTGYSLTQSFPSNFSSLGITAGGHITTVDTLTNAPSDSSGVTTLLSRIGGAITISGGGVNVSGDLSATMKTSVQTAADAAVTANSSVVSISTAVGDLYHADIQLTKDDANSKDEYTVSWFKNGIVQTSGITVPTIEVIKRSDGTDLVASTAMSSIGSTGGLKYDEPTNRITAGEAVLVTVTATINAGTRTFRKVITRDSA